MGWIWDWRDGRPASGLVEVTAFEPLLRVDEDQDEFLDPALRDLKIIGP